MHDQLVSQLKVKLRNLPPGQDMSELAELARMTIDLVKYAKRTDDIRTTVSDLVFRHAFRMYEDMWLLSTYIDKSIGQGSVPFENPPEYIQKILDKARLHDYHEAYGIPVKDAEEDDE